MENKDIPILFISTLIECVGPRMARLVLQAYEENKKLFEGAKAKNKKPFKEEPEIDDWAKNQLHGC